MCNTKIPIPNNNIHRNKLNDKLLKFEIKIIDSVGNTISRNNNYLPFI